MGKITKALLSLFFVSVAATIILGGIYYSRSKKLLPHSSELVTSIAEQRGEQIAKFIAQQESNAVTVAQLPIVAQLIVGKVTHESFAKQIQRYADLFEVENILVIEPSGKVLFSLDQAVATGTRLFDVPSELSYSLMRVVLSMTPDVSSFEFDPLIKRTAVYSSVPIFKDKTLIGMVALQLNEQSIADSVTNYLGLGSTGEVVLGSRTADGTRIIMPTRNDPDASFKKPLRFSADEPFPLQVAVRGTNRLMEAKDYRNKQVLAATYYIPNADIGLVAKIDIQEMFASLVALRSALLALGLLALVLGILVLLFGLGGFSQKIRQFMRRWLFSAYTVAFLMALSLLAASGMYYHRFAIKRRALGQTKQLAQELVDEGVDKLTRSLKKIAFLANSTAADLNAGRLLPEDIITSMKRDINENDLLFGMIVAYKPHAYKDKKLFAPYISRADDGFSLKQLEESRDYTLTRNGLKETTAWYAEPLSRRRGLWLDPQKDPLSDTLVAIYSVPFYDPSDEEKQNPLGVVAALYAIDSLKKRIAPLHIGQTGYPFMLSEQGTYLYHPIQRYVAQQKTLFSVAEAQGDEALYDTGKAMIKGEQGQRHYWDDTAAQEVWVNYKPIPQTGWSMGLLFSEQEVTVPQRKLHHLRIWFIVLMVIAAILLSVLLTGYLVRPWQRQLKVVAFASSLLFLVGLVALWRQVRELSTQQAAHGVPITSQVSLDSFMADATERAKRRNAPAPLELPTGIFVHSWKFSDETQLEVASNIWQNYADHSQLERGLYLPQSTDREKELLSSTKDRIEWHVVATLAQQFNYAQYPFDSQRISILLEHNDRTKNIILVPDMASYTSLKPTDIPGVSKQFRFSGYTIERSFFTFETLKDADQAQDIKERVALNFSIIVARDLLNAIIIYLLPLLVVIFSLFAIFAATGEIGESGKVFVSLRGYTALLFALLVLHRTLRAQYPTGDVLYIEYLFFYTYLTILLVIVHGAIVQARYKPQLIKRISPLLKTLFWPVQLAVWFITTVIIFY